jgi:hypothetical protein
MSKTFVDTPLGNNPVVWWRCALRQEFFQRNPDWLSLLPTSNIALCNINELRAYFGRSEWNHVMMPKARWSIAK